MSDEVQRVPRLPLVSDDPGDRLRDSHPAIAAGRQLHLAVARAEYLGELLADQLAAEGIAGLIEGDRAVQSKDGTVIPVPESVRALVTLEAAERDRVAAMSATIARLGLDEARARQDVAQVVSGALLRFADEVGLPMTDDRVLRAAKRSGLAATQPEVRVDQVAGPAVSVAERAALLAAAAAEARGDAGSVVELPGR